MRCCNLHHDSRGLEHILLMALQFLDGHNQSKKVRGAAANQLLHLLLHSHNIPHLRDYLVPTSSLKRPTSVVILPTNAQGYHRLWTGLDQHRAEHNHQFGHINGKYEQPFD